jgi:DNA-binding CsgD family transcriptional regulator
VTALAARDAERVLRFVAEADDLGGDEPFTPELLVELGLLVPADWIGYCEKDLRHQRVLVLVDRAGDEDTYADIPDDELFPPETNVILRRRKEGYLGALRLSALLTRREFRTAWGCSDILERFGVSDMLHAVIPAPARYAKEFAFDRTDGTFSDRDVLVLDHLQPHLERLWRTAETRRLLRAALESLESAWEHDSRGAIVIGRGGRIDYASPAARRLLREYFGTHDSAELPSKIVEWLESDLTTLSWPEGECRVSVDRAGDALVLRETLDPLSALTLREREVLGLVAEGRTNPEIAETLWITPSTVRKHLENVYAKLGVRTRTAAAARFLQVLPE